MSLPNDSICQKEYLKKYLSVEDVKKKKKKKISTNKVKRSTIIDDDIDLKNMRPLNDDEVELYQMDEDAPQIAGIIDERPAEVKAQEQYNSKRWKVFGRDDGVNIVDSLDKSQLSVSDKLSAMSKKFDTSRDKPYLGRLEEIDKKDVLDKKMSKKENELRNKSSADNDSDMSPPRNCKHDKILNTNKKYINKGSNNVSEKQKKPQSHNDSDLSPPRNDKTNSTREKYSSDPSPPRRGEKKKHAHSDSDVSPPRRDSRETRRPSDKSLRGEQKRVRRRGDSDISPPRRDKGKRSRYKSNSDISPPQKEKKMPYKANIGSDSDPSPPRGKEKENKFKIKYDFHKTRHRRSGSESSLDTSDSSLPRRSGKRSEPYKRYSPESTKRKRSSRSSTPSLKSALLNKILQVNKPKTSVPSRLSRRDLMNKNNVKRHFSDSDDSPPRRRSNSFRQDDINPDMSPPRKKSLLKKDKPLMKVLYKPHNSSSSDETSRSKSKKMKTTLDGKQAGLQDARQLRKELSDLRMKEDLMFSKLDASVSGLGAAPIKRDKKTGQVRDMEKEKEAQREKDVKASAVNEKYQKWGRGLKQVEDAAEHAAAALKEMDKPLARYVDDEDLDNFLKAQDREGDPMLDYIKQKQKEATPLVGEKPIYKGSYSPNRFGIRPGHRWDGVVRSNGYEKEWFTHQNARKARDEDAYKWSTSDM